MSATTVPKPEDARKKQIKRVLSVVLSIAIVLVIFLKAIPKLGGGTYQGAWDSIRSVPLLDLWPLVVAMIFNLFTYWWANMAALPGLSLGQAAVVTQTTTSIANTIPAGGAIAVGMTYTILRSWGFRGSDTALYVGTTGIWNVFTKMALPVISVAFLAVSNHSGAAYVIPAVVGLAMLAAAVGCLAAVFHSEQLARKVGKGLGRGVSVVRRLLRRPAVLDGGERAAAFRRDTIGLVERRWLRLTLTTILSHLALFLVLLLALRRMGVHSSDISTAEAFAAFAVGRLLAMVPLTGGGVGFVEGGYIGILKHFDPTQPNEILAAVLLFRLLTFGIQIPLGGFTYVIWQRMTRWRKAPPDAEPAGTAAQASPATG